MKAWEVQYGWHRIRVENDWAGERLFVDDELQDERIGLLMGRSRLYGKLSDEDGRVVSIKVSIGDEWIFLNGCRIFVDDRLIFSSRWPRGQGFEVIRKQG